MVTDQVCLCFTSMIVIGFVSNMWGLLSVCALPDSRPDRVDLAKVFSTTSGLPLLQVASLLGPFYQKKKSPWSLPASLKLQASPGLLSPALAQSHHFGHLDSQALALRQILARFLWRERGRALQCSG